MMAFYKEIHCVVATAILYGCLSGDSAVAAATTWQKAVQPYLQVADSDDEGDDSDDDDNDDGDDDGDDDDNSSSHSGGGLDNSNHSSGSDNRAQSSSTTQSTHNSSSTDKADRQGGAFDRDHGGAFSEQSGGKSDSRPWDTKVQSNPQTGGFFSLFSRQLPLEAMADRSLARYRPNTVLATYRGCQTAISPPAGMKIIASRCSGGSSNLQLVSYRLHNMGVTAAVKRLKRRKGVVSAQPDFYYQAAGRDAADYGRRLVQLHKTPQHYTGQGVTVGLIDSVIDTRHNALKEAQIVQHDIFDFKVTDKHATAIGGILLGTRKVRGVAPKIRLVSVPAFYLDAQNRRISSTFYLTQALEKMQQQNIRLLNLSFVGHQDDMVKQLIRALQKKGVIVVAAAGNAGGESERIYPAAYPAVIGVTAVDARQQLYRQATVGNHVDYAAPGVKLLALAPRSRYGLVSGTSFATAYVTGLLALLKQHDNSNKAALRLLRKHSKDLGKRGKDTRYGHGLISSPW